MTSFIAISSLLSSIVAAPSHALSALGWTSSNNNPATTASTRGFAFNVVDANGVTVTDLSFYDENGDGLAQSHDIGLWDSTGILLASATASAGVVNPLSVNGLFRTVAVTPFLLPQGNNYAVGALFLANSGDRQAFNFINLTTPSQISYVETRFINDASLARPTNTNSVRGLPGGSFEFTPVTPVPFEFNPGLGLALLGGGLLWKKLSKKKS